VIAGLADVVAVMYAGRIVESGDIDDVLDRPGHPYTSGLIGSIPSRNQRGQRLQQIPGMTPSLLNLPVGCAFRSRCTYAQEVCAVAPEVSGGDDGRRRLRCHLPLLGGGLSQESV
jgi:peptide/nickel transport system ATP-binding protein